ncbi:MAG: hypothetical protein K6U09_07985 [Acidobacteriia bacterium]|jgi:hypothetical protein|nr:hypothetical protein [Terriglobia bacterium]
MACPLCQKRTAKRWCPAKGERICAVCCGTEREVTVDCPSDCEFLIAARRYEADHRPSLPPEAVPYPDVAVTVELLHELRPVLAELGLEILKLSREHPPMVDADVLAALHALTESCRTLVSGLYYEKPPEAGYARALYVRLAEAIARIRARQAERVGFAALKDSEVLALLVFLLRLARYHSNGRPRSRAFLDFLRAQYPKQAGLAPEPPRIIVP